MTQGKGNKVYIEWNVNHIGFAGGGSRSQTFRGVKSEKAARNIISKRDTRAMLRAVWTERLPDGKTREVDLLAFPR